MARKSKAEKQGKQRKTPPSLMGKYREEKMADAVDTSGGAGEETKQAPVEEPKIEQPPVVDPPPPPAPEVKPDPTPAPALEPPKEEPRAEDPSPTTPPDELQKKRDMARVAELRRRMEKGEKISDKMDKWLRDYEGGAHYPKSSPAEEKKATGPSAVDLPNLAKLTAGLSTEKIATMWAAASVEILKKVQADGWPVPPEALSFAVIYSATAITWETWKHRLEEINAGKYAPAVCALPLMYRGAQVLTQKITKPKKGEAVTQEQAAAKVAEKREEKPATPPAPPVTVIR